MKKIIYYSVESEQADCFLPDRVSMNFEDRTDAILHMNDIADKVRAKLERLEVYDEIISDKTFYDMIDAGRSAVRQIAVTTRRGRIELFEIRCFRRTLFLRDKDED